MAERPRPTEGGAGVAGAPRAPRDERGSQAVELALSLPLLALVLILLLQGGLLAMDLVNAQGLAREAARVAAVADDATTQSSTRSVAGARPVRLELAPASPRRPGDLVTATLRVRTRAFEALGFQIWLPAQARMRVEDR